MIRSFALSVVVLFASGAFAVADTSYRSAHREPGRSYLNYKHRARTFSIEPEESAPLTPLTTAKKVTTLDQLPPATVWESEKVMVERFKRFRDERFLTVDSRPDFLRRSSWLYPDDGCFARAALAVRNLAHWGVALPKKVFAFGDLLVNTPNSPDGSVAWWYHVAPLVEVAGQKYVLDPALEPHHPLKLDEWLAMMSTTPQNLEVTVCESGSYTPGDDCSKVSDGEEAYAMDDQKMYLEFEWQRLVDLNRNPERELGEFPPWLQ